MKPLSFLLLSGLAFNGFVHADDADSVIQHPWLKSDFLVQIGSFLPDKDILISARGNAEVETKEVDFDQTFKGGSRESIFAINLKWDFGQKWWLGAESYSAKFEEGAVLESDLEWNDYVFPAGSYASGGTSMDLYRVVIGRDVYRSDRSELGLGLGLHWLELGAFIEGEALIGDEASGVRKEAVTASAPLPNVTLWYLHTFSPKWAAFIRADWFGASFKEYSGNLINANVGINYQFTDHFGIDFAYKSFELDVDVDKPDWYGRVKYDQTGPFIGLSGNW